MINWVYYEKLGFSALNAQKLGEKYVFQVISLDFLRKTVFVSEKKTQLYFSNPICFENWKTMFIRWKTVNMPKKEREKKKHSLSSDKPSFST